MDNFLTSDTWENQSYDKMYADYGFINGNKLIFTKEISQFLYYPERVFWTPLFNQKMMTSWWWVILMRRIFWNFESTINTAQKEKKLWWKFLWKIHVLKIRGFFSRNSDMAIVSLTDKEIFFYNLNAIFQQILQIVKSKTANKINSALGLMGLSTQIHFEKN